MWSRTKVTPSLFLWLVVIGTAFGTVLKQATEPLTANEESGCTFSDGDIIDRDSRTEKLMTEKAETEKDCESLVLEKQGAYASGATWDPANKRCWAEFGNTIKASSVYRTCLFSSRESDWTLECSCEAISITTEKPEGKKTTLKDCKKSCEDDPKCTHIDYGIGSRKGECFLNFGWDLGYTFTDTFYSYRLIRKCDPECTNGNECSAKNTCTCNNKAACDGEKKCYLNECV